MAELISFLTEDGIRSFCGQCRSSFTCRTTGLCTDETKAIHEYASCCCDMTEIMLKAT